MIQLKVGDELIAAVELAMKADRPVLLDGQTGIGKSECLIQAARQQGLECIVRDLSLMEAPDLAGLPVIRGNQMSYAAPTFLPRDGRGLLVFEEINRCPRQVRVPCLQLLTARQLNDYRLPDGWRLAAACNPDGEDYDVEPLDPALLARFVVLRVVADVKSWVAWAERSGVHPAVCRYVRATPEIFSAKQSNPRGWKYVSDLVTAFEREEGKSSSNSLLADVAGLVGDDLATAFLRTYHAGARTGVPSAEEVMGSSRKVSTRVRRAADEGDTAFFASLTHNVRLFLQEPANESATREDEKAVGNLQRVLKHFPADLREKLRADYPWIEGRAA
jgi:hypothetical protein